MEDVWLLNRHVKKMHLRPLHVQHIKHKEMCPFFFFVRLEKEIQDLEKAELQISANEEAILKKLKSIERTTEDIIRVSVTQC